MADELDDDTPLVHTLDELRSEQERTLNFSVVAAHLTLNLVSEISSKLIGPLADIDLSVLDDDEQSIVLREAQKTAQRLRSTIQFALATHADIEEAANLDGGVG